MAGFPSKAKGNIKGDKAKRPKPGIPLDKTVIAELIVSTGGNLSRMADMMGTTRGCLRRICAEDTALKDALENARERQIDELEESVWDRAKNGQDTTLQLFLLKTQARHRGYDQSEAQHTAKDIATAAFDYIINQSKDK